MIISPTGIIIGLAGLAITLLINLVLVAYSYGKIQQLVSDMHEIIHELKVTVQKLVDKTDDHAAKLIELDTLTQTQKGRRGVR